MPTPGKVLIVGAGTGTDVALALSRGASYVDAVEIDPRLQQIGAQKHPDLPYSDPRVHVHINDGRAFLERSNAKYNMIIFALPDSLTLVAGASSLRLESYLFTVESMRSVKKHLAPGGAFAMYNFYREDWLIGRLARTVGEASAMRRALTSSAPSMPSSQRASPRRTNAAAQEPRRPAQRRPPTTTRSSISSAARYRAFYLITLARHPGDEPHRGSSSRRSASPDAAIPRSFPSGLGVSAPRDAQHHRLRLAIRDDVDRECAGLRRCATRRAGGCRSHKTMADAALKVLYGMLAVGLAIATIVRPGLLLGFPLVPRALLAVTVAFLPIFVANLVFAKRFADTADATSAFGANLLGAMVGGCLEYTSLIIGYQALLGVAALLYMQAHSSCSRKHRPPRPDRAGQRGTFAGVITMGRREGVDRRGVG